MRTVDRLHALTAKTSMLIKFSIPQMEFLCYQDSYVLNLVRSYNRSLSYLILKKHRRVYLSVQYLYAGLGERSRKRSSNATPLVETRQDVPLGPIVEGVLYGWWHGYGYAYTSVSRALLYTSWQALHRVFLYNTTT